MEQFVWDSGPKPGDSVHPSGLSLKPPVLNVWNSVVNFLFPFQLT